ncbi:MAG: LysM peptidoglycan-binding domain-containing protein, partial [Opitutales bacterium]|nr:LysM peptidoglycan-binding domain-containing protein [Opitutales bacterium]
PGCQTTPQESAEVDTGLEEDPDYWSSGGETRQTATDARSGRSEPRRPDAPSLSTGRSDPRRPETAAATTGAESDEWDDDFLTPADSQPREDRTRTTTPDPVETSSQEGEYVVQRGDTLSIIARNHGVTLNRLLAANDLRMNSVIHPGDRLEIPEGTTTTTDRERTSRTAETSTYTVRRGDTLSHIASQHGISVRDLRELNSLQGDLIREGQELRVPRRSEVSEDRNQSDQSSIRRASGATYTVQAGDTPGAIANRFGVSTQELMRANNISDPRRMRVGQELTIPGQDSGREERSERRESTPRERTTSREETSEEVPEETDTPIRVVPFEEDPDFENFEDDDFPEVELVPE